MTDTASRPPSTAAASAAAVFNTAACPAHAYCEGFHSSSLPREHWEPILTALAARGSARLEQDQDRVDRMRHEDGATFNPFDDTTGRGTPWSLDIIPLPLTSQDWAHIEAGLVQRVRLLEKILADIYGPQRLLREGHLPPELVYANPGFLRACHGIQPADNRFVVQYAADLVRGPDGQFRVIRDYGAIPAGLGFALENRIVMSRVLPELYHKTQVRRLAPFFHAFHNHLVNRAPGGREASGIVLLSSGPDSPMYFEHALLSRYLGYPLVEGQDLTVRNGLVYLKKLAGLEPVGTIIRHIDDHQSDPFALRRESASGVAGLIQVAREQQIRMVNPVGSGYVETPVLPAFLPDLCRLFMDAELELDSFPVLWCGTPDGRRQVLEAPEAFTVLPALDRSLPLPKTADEAAAAIREMPHAYMARQPVGPAVVPVWGDDGVNNRFCLLRVFACATEQGVGVMPGGLAITAEDVETLTGDLLTLQQSKDVWVLSDQPVEPFSLLEGLHSVAEFNRGSDLPSRVADHLFWLGRYLERAEGMVRQLRSVFRRLSGEERLDEIPELPFLLNLLSAENAIPSSDGKQGKVPRYGELSNQLNTALYDSDRAESVVSVLTRVREAARHVRDRLSADSWRVINRLDAFTTIPAGDPLELLDETLFTLSAFSGLAMESMTRGLGWRFMDMGRRSERAMNQVALIRIALPDVCAESRGGLEALLEVSDSIMTYRARYRTVFQLAPVLDLLLVDESNPKSVAFQFSRLAEHVDRLPRQSDRRFASTEERLALEMLTAIRLLELADARCSGRDDRIADLEAFLERMEERLKQFSQQISAHYLTRVAATPHFSIIRESGTP